MKVYPIVEGHGEVEAAPVLLRRLLAEADCQNVGVGRPIRRTQSQLRSKEGIQAGVRLALLQPECAAVVILFDGEDDCPKCDECERVFHFHNCVHVVVTCRAATNAKRQPREAAAAGTRIHAERNGCLPLAARSGWASSCGLKRSLHLCQPTPPFRYIRPPSEGDDSIRSLPPHRIQRHLSNLGIDLAVQDKLRQS